MDRTDELTDLLLARHHATFTADDRAVVRADHLWATAADSEDLPSALARWLDTPRPTRTGGLCRLPLRAGTGAHVEGLLADIAGERYRRLSMMVIPAGPTIR